MARRFRGPAVTENVQTGDGRVIAAGAITWAELPLPFAWIRDGDQHINLTEVAPQVGIIESLVREGDDIMMEGTIDDGGPDGAELCRRMDAGLASHGARQFVSIDPDDWAVEVLWMGDDGDEDELLLASAGRGMPPRRIATGSGGVAVAERPVTAAAGEPDPGREGGEVIFEDRADIILERYTAMRIRGATACAVSAFTSAWIELVDASDAGAAGEAVTAAMPGMPEHEFTDPDGNGFCNYCVTADDAGDCTMVCGMTEAMHSMVLDGASTTASARLRPSRTTTAAAPTLIRPPAEAFTLPEPEPGDTDDGSVYGMPVQELLVEQPDGGLAVPFTIVERDGVRWCFGHAARWGQCHVGYPGQCITAPESACGYAHFHHGSVVCADGSTLATGPLSMGTDHADADLLAPDARDHYANTGLAFADVRATNGSLGVWVSGAVRATVTELQLQVVRASSLSGDWRRIGVDLEFIGALAVNVPGFPIARELVAAAGLAQLPMAALAASAYQVDGVQQSLVAAGVVQRCPECQQRAMAGRQYARQLQDAQPTVEQTEALRLLRTIELRTRHLTGPAAEHALATIRR